MEGNLRQLLGLIVKRDFQILFPEEFRIGQARGENFLITRNNRCAAVMRINVSSADKGVGQLARFVMTDKIFLVHTRG